MRLANFRLLPVIEQADLLYQQGVYMDKRKERG